MDKRKRKQQKRKQEQRSQARRRAGAPAVADPRVVDAALDSSASDLRAGRPERAEATLRKAVKAAGFEPRMVANLLNALRAQGKHESGLALARRSAEANPERAASWHDLGAMAKVTGALDEARAAFRRAVELDPKHGESWRNLSTLTTRESADDPDLAAMERALEGRPANDPARASVHFALARGLEQVGRYDEAFEHYVKGNRLARTRTRHDPAVLERIVDGVIARYDADWFARGPVAGASAAAPILVVGMPRSGTSLVEQILSCHPDVAGVGEVTDLPAAVRDALGGAASEPPPIAASDLDDASLARMGARYASSLAGREPDAARVVDKYLSNALHVGLLARALPGARIIHASRDPKDNLVACFTAYFTTGAGFVWDLDEIEHARAQYDRLRDHWTATTPATFMDLSYEELVDDQEGQTRRILEHCGLGWDDACMAPERAERAVTSASAVQVRSPVNRSSIGRWRRFEAQLAKR